jgi:hypothetical protein
MFILDKTSRPISSAVSIAVLCAGKSSAGTWENKIEKQVIYY